MVLKVDGEVGVVGSANLNHRSLQLDEEVDVVPVDPEVTARLDAGTHADLDRSERLSSDELLAAAHAARAPLRALTGPEGRATARGPRLPCREVSDPGTRSAS